MRYHRYALTVLFLSLLTIPVASSGEIRARSSATATGNMVVVWGDPFGTMQVSQGTGSETLMVRGNVTPRTDLPGFYVYDRIRLTGKLHAEWTLGTDQYVLDASFVLVADETVEMPTTIVPDADSFAVLGMDFTATLSMNGETRTAHGIAALVAAAPGYFGYEAESRTTTVILYQSFLGAQFVFRWAETSQVIYGVEVPAADRLRQKVIMT